MENNKPKDMEQRNHLSEAEAPIRAIILAELPRAERERVTEMLVESAMTMGLLEADKIKEWLGVDSLQISSINATVRKVKEKWLQETSDGYAYASEQRATQINKAWEEVRTCEKLFEDALTTADKVKVKKLQLEWLQYVSKLSFVDKLVESTTPDMSITVNGGMTVASADD